MVTPGRFELSTDRLEGDCSIQLSYEVITTGTNRLYNKIHLLASLNTIEKMKNSLFFNKKKEIEKKWVMYIVKGAIMKSIVVKQTEIYDCGACCLDSIIKYYNGYVPIEYIKLDTKTNKNGTTAYNIINAAKKYGFEGIGIKLKNIKENEVFPMIAHLVLKNGLNHFVVVSQVKGNKVYLMDPAKGNTKMNIKEFNKIWSKVIIILKPIQKISSYKSNNIIKEITNNILKNEKTLIIRLLIYSIIITFISLILSYQIKISISSIESSTINTTILVSILFVLLTILKLYSKYKRNEYEIYLNKNINMSIILPFIEHIIKLPLNVIKTKTPGEIITRINSLNNVKEAFSEIFVTVILDLGLALSAGLILYMINSKLFLILCIISIIYIIFGVSINPFINNKINDNIDLETLFNSTLNEEISNITTTKNLNRINKSINTINNKYIDYTKDTLDYINFLNKYSITKESIYEVGLLLINIVGIFLILLNQLSLLNLITFNSLLMYYINPITNTIDLLPKINLIKASIIKVNEFLIIKEEKEGKEQEFINGDISIKNLNYSYDDYHNIINDINIYISKNEKVQIKGRSGTGKSTICQILAKILDNYKGTITINDINIKDYSLKTIRKNIRYVSQNEKLYTDTIENNIIMNNKISKAELNKILEVTKVDEIINKKSLRLNAMLLDGGFNLSGGEKERLILARALITKPQILILDETLSEVNEDLELEILTNIKDYLSNSTIIYISHHKQIPNFRSIELNANV